MDQIDGFYGRLVGASDLPSFHDLLTGDERQDKENSVRFAKILEGGVVPVSESGERIVLEIGTDKWPFPIPLVKRDGAWLFDTAAGKQEIIDAYGRLIDAGMDYIIIADVPGLATPDVIEFLGEEILPAFR